MKRLMLTRLTVFGVALSLFSAQAVAADASARAEKWEIFLAPMWMDDMKVDGDHGSSADLNGRSALGLGFAYNINNHFEVGMLFNASSGSYSATVVKDDGTRQSYNGTMYSSSVLLGGTYNFLEGPLTPYVGADIGSTYIDSNIPTGNTIGGCWWDPWWGYVCSQYPETYTSTNFSYGFDLGVRYDLEKVYFKAGVGKNYIDASNAFDVTLYSLIFGFKF